MLGTVGQGGDTPSPSVCSPLPGFLDKNNDLLFRNLKEVRETGEPGWVECPQLYVHLSLYMLSPDPPSASQTMCSSMNPIMAQCFDKSELSDKKRPETVRRL